MKVDIISQPFSIQVYGYGNIALNKDYAGTAFKLSNRTWETIKNNNLNNKGINVWIYESGDMVFAGVELSNIPEDTFNLEQKNIVLSKYAYYKHIGPYKLIKQVGQNMQTQLMDMGHQTCLPYIEIYGHWTGDETTTETELLMSLK